MPDSDSSTLIVSIPGTQDTQELSRAAVIAGIQRGEISQDQWIWSPEHNDWKQVREFPELQSGLMTLPKSAPQTIQPTAAKVPQAAQQPVAATATPKAAVKVPQAAAQPAVAKAPQAAKVKVGPSQTQQLAGTRYSQPMEVKHEFPYFKILLGAGFLALAGIIGGNYLLINEPLETNLAATGFRAVQVYGHLGAFVQPGALVIHVVPTKTLTADNFADFLIALAKSSPQQPINGKAFTNIGLTTAWQSQYAMDGESWQRLGQLKGVSDAAKTRYVIEHLLQINGAPLVIKHAGDSPEEQTKKATAAWQALVSHFQGQ